MDDIMWNVRFPNHDQMLNVLKRTISISWRNSLTLDDIYIWLQNFTGEVYKKSDEQRLALWMLCNFTYYNDNEIQYLCKIIYKFLLHDLAKNNNIDLLSSNQISFSALGEASDSGDFLMYFFRQQTGLNKKNFVYSNQIFNEEKSTLVFIDDVALSGNSAAKFFDKHKSDIKDKHIYYITLLASQDAVTELSKYGITLLYTTLLDDRDKCFSENSLMFSNFPELRKIAKRMVLEYGTKIMPKHPLGYNEGQYSFGFYYNTPNNALPIYWSNNNNWAPIFPRTGRIIHQEQEEINHGKYI